MDIVVSKAASRRKRIVTYEFTILSNACHSPVPRPAGAGATPESRPTEAYIIAEMDVDYEKWKRRWQSMRHKRIANPSTLDPNALTGLDFGEIEYATISAMPPEHVNTMFIKTDVCPLCSSAVNADNRLAASLHPVFARLKNISVGVWVHEPCFRRLENSNEPTPFPY